LTTREEIFYTTKLKTNVSRLDTVDKIKKSLKTSTLSYIDLYLLHSPIGGKGVREECWKGCMDAKEYGWVKSIGESSSEEAERDVTERCDNFASEARIHAMLRRRLRARTTPFRDHRRVTGRRCVTCTDRASARHQYLPSVDRR
jgi:diketogulonate reductase-like aldo/keto reductase